MPLNVFWFRHTYSIPCWATLCFNITLTSVNMNSFWLSCCKPTTDKLRDLADILQIPHCNITGAKYIRHCWKCHISLIWKQYRTNCYSNGSIRLNHSCPKDRSNVNISILLHVLHWPFSASPSVLWRCWLGGRKGIRPVKNWVVGCWRGYLSGARCRLAYGPADATATHCLLLQ